MEHERPPLAAIPVPLAASISKFTYSKFDGSKKKKSLLTDLDSLFDYPYFRSYHWLQ
ncbi:hypothetical protein [Flavisolibacter tropicus]|uniref:hypothetical protein n=1 Tax=Flavisolibacter tropicus TaxID=1492898 RepID=UPI001313E008|nr:hypothetical protein [Flavisolibacter tropicus]